MDEDLERMSREQLIEEAKALRRGIREHRDSTRHELLLAPSGSLGPASGEADPVPVVPEWPEFLRGCVKYRESLDEQARGAPRTTEPYPGSRKDAS